MRDGWIETTLGDVAEWWSGGTPKAREPKYYENGTIPWAVIADMNKGIINSTNSYITEDALDLIGGRLAPVGSVLISMYASVGKSAIANIPLATNQAIAWSIPNKKKIIPFYLYLVSQQLEKEISDLARGATQRNINRQMLREFTFQLPPLFEQKRIVDLISSVDDYIDALQQQLESAKRFRNAVLHELMTAGGDDWVETTLGDVADWSSGKNISKNSRVSDGEYSIIGANGEIGRTDQFLYDQPLVVVGRVGSCGETYLIHGKVWISDNALIALPYANIEISYLYYLLKTFDYKKIISGTTQPLITQGKLKTQSIFLPPLPEQKRIVEIVDTIDEIISQTELTTSKAQNLRSGLLLDLLSGEHEIPSSYDKVMGAA